MTLTKEQIKTLTESKYWRPEIGVAVKVVMSNWRFEMIKYKDSEPRPALVTDVIEVNGVKTDKCFTSGNKWLNSVLITAMQYAEQEQRTVVHLHFLRTGKNDYQVVDLRHVEKALG